MATPSQRWTVARLGTAQTLAWASSYYLPAMLAAPMARDLGVAAPTVFAAFSLALVVSALLGPLAGHAIDRPAGYGARQGLMMVPARVAQAFAPVLFGMLLDGVGAAAVWLTAGLGVAALAALWVLRPLARA